MASPTMAEGPTPSVAMMSPPVERQSFVISGGFAAAMARSRSESSANSGSRSGARTCTRARATAAGARAGRAHLRASRRRSAGSPSLKRFSRAACSTRSPTVLGDLVGELEPDAELLGLGTRRGPPARPPSGARPRRGGMGGGAGKPCGLRIRASQLGEKALEQPRLGEQHEPSSARGERSTLTNSSRTRSRATLRNTGSVGGIAAWVAGSSVKPSTVAKRTARMGRRPSSEKRSMRRPHAADDAGLSPPGRRTDRRAPG